MGILKSCNTLMERLEKWGEREKRDYYKVNPKSRTQEEDEP